MPAPQSGDAVHRRPLIWPYRHINVRYTPELDGGGTVLAAPFVEFLQAHPQRPPEDCTVFEWCAGPAFIGFALLAEGFCGRLILADINPDAVACIAQTVADNHLEDRVQYYTSDNFSAIPPGVQFDLVVANPPNYFSINPDHPLGALFHADRRPNDPGWKIHSNFYASVARYMCRGGLVCVSEIEPHETVVRIPRSLETPFERRPAPPHAEFQQMIGAGGLTYVETVKYAILPGDVGAWMMVARRDRD